MRHDPFEKKTHIPFRVDGGRLVHFYDKRPITELREGAVGDLVVNDYAVGDETRVRQYNAEREVLFLPKGTRLLARISSRSVPKDLKGWVIEENKFIGAGAVEVVLKGDLHLRLRGTKEAQLLPCPSEVPALTNSLKEDEQPSSVNHAYTLISRHFEPHRRANTGNVFNGVFYCQAPLNVWKPLKHLRDQFQAEHETTVVAAKPESDIPANLLGAAPQRAGLAEAIAIAAEAHVKQTDKAGAPYILHPLRVMQRLTTEAEMIVAVLHDVVEDTHWELEDLRAAGFQDDVLEAIDCLTRREEETYDDFIERAKSHPVARRVKLADIEDNLNVTRLSEMTDRDVERLRKYHRIRRMLIEDSGA